MIKTVSQKFSKENCSRVNIEHSLENTTPYCHDEKILIAGQNGSFPPILQKKGHQVLHENVEPRNGYRFLH